MTRRSRSASFQPSPIELQFRSVDLAGLIFRAPFGRLNLRLTKHFLVLGRPLRAHGSLKRNTSRNQVVHPISIGDFDDVTDITQIIDFFTQNNPHQKPFRSYPLSTV